MDIPVQQLSLAQKEVFTYWRRQAGDRIAPRRQDLDVLDIPTLMPHVIIFEILHDPLDFRYRLFGTAIREMATKDFTGSKMSEIDGRGPGSKIWSLLDSVRVSQKPAYHSIPYVGPKKDFLRLNDLFLPLVDDNMETNMIMLISHFERKETA